MILYVLYVFILKHFNCSVYLNYHGWRSITLRHLSIRTQFRDGRKYGISRS